MIHQNKVITLFLVFILFSCSNSEEEYTDIITVTEEEMLASVLNLPADSYNYADVVLPNYFLDNNLVREDNIPNNNAITNDGATLGRVLFYDTNLSLNNSTSCASCHVQANGFSDSKILSDGFNGGKTGRHSMSLANARFYRNGRFFWDERAA
ncbi:MAG: cytochrome-c peroxidase, partial [Flavobacteriaceae bacterium]|nr:cytochrome-c peroxidase [Flavobacteriaceae bacterium]